MVVREVFDYLQENKKEEYTIKQIAKNINESEQGVIRAVGKLSGQGWIIGTMTRDPGLVHSNRGCCLYKIRGGK